MLVEDEWPRDEVVGIRGHLRGGEGDRGHQHRSHARTLARGLAIAALAGATLAGCHDRLDEVDGAFYDGDGRRVHCAINLDTSANSRVANIDSGLDRARDRNEVIELFAHVPGGSVPVSKIAHLLAGARDRGLGFVTYADFAHGSYASPGLALSFDDTAVEAWLALRPLFQEYGARVTFFVTRYHTFSDAQLAGLEVLAADGHDIEPHSAGHFRAPEYVESHGLAAYLRDELEPSIAALRNDGYEVSAFAYPFGARTGELDDAIAERVPVLRSVVFSYTLVQDPCPR